MRTKAEQSLDEQNALIAKLEDVAEWYRRHNRAVSPEALMLRRLLTTEQKRRDMARRTIERQRARGR